MFQLLTLVIRLWTPQSLPYLSTEDFDQVIGKNVLKVVGNTEQPSSEKLKDFSRLFKPLKRKANIQHRLSETATNSREENDKYPMDITNLKLSTRFINGNLENILTNLKFIRQEPTTTKFEILSKPQNSYPYPSSLEYRSHWLNKILELPESPVRKGYRRFNRMISQRWHELENTEDRKKQEVHQKKAKQKGRLVK